MGYMTRAAKRQRRMSEFLVQGSPQIVISSQPLLDQIEEAMETANEIAEAIDVYDENLDDIESRHLVDEELDDNMSTHKLVRFAHGKGRHFLPLQPGILQC